jgi:hypothetical protein
VGLERSRVQDVVRCAGATATVWLGSFRRIRDDRGSETLSAGGDLRLREVGGRSIF